MAAPPAASQIVWSEFVAGWSTASTRRPGEGRAKGACDVTINRISSLLMSQPSDADFRLLHAVAEELRDVFGERGYRVDVAMEVDPAFGSGWARAAVTRDLVIDAVSGAASRQGLDFRPVNGGGREFRTLTGTIERRFRLRRAVRRADGSLLITASSASALAIEDGALFAGELWAFAWTLSDDGQIDEVLACEVTGYVEGMPGHLKLGHVFALTGDNSPTGGFRPTEEDLTGFEDERDAGEGFGSSAS